VNIYLRVIALKANMERRQRNERKRLLSE